jgi:hypothetical protein
MEQLLTEVHENLLDLEALSHTPDGGVVAVDLSFLLERTNTAHEDWANDG